MASRTPPLDDDGFRAPKRRNRTGKSKPNSTARPRPSEVLTNPLSPITLLEAAPIDKFALDSVLKWKLKLRESPFWKAITCLPIFSTQLPPNTLPGTSVPIPLRKINRIICLGLGSLATGDFAIARSRPQLAFFLLLLELLESAKLQDSKEKTPLRIGVCDPLFTASDVALVKHLGFELLENRCGAYSASSTLLLTTKEDERPTQEDGTGEDGGMLCFMPHCPKELYASILSANWNSKDLSRLVIIGNSFSSITSAPACDVEKMRNGRVFAVERVQSEAIFPDYEDPFIFNNTAIHLFDEASSISQEDPFWSIEDKEKDALKGLFEVQVPS